MIKNNKGKFIISSLVMLLPIPVAALINAFVAPLGKGSVGFFAIVSLVTLAIHIGAMILSDKLGNIENQSKKIINMTYFIIPMITLYTSGVMMAIMLGTEPKMSFLIAPVMGFAFIIIGNYMPKSVRNRTFGIKIKWTLSSDENWNVTHRFVGKLWVICGVLTLVMSLLPDMIFLIAFFAIITISIIASVIYSYSYYKKQIAEGSVKKEDFSYSKTDKTIGKISVVSITVILIFVAVLMFTGKLNFTFDDDSLLVKPTFGGQTDIEYSSIESIEYREEMVGGSRVMGYASAKLLYGTFTNKEFGTYTRYTYTAGGSCIVLSVNGETIVLAADSAENTKAIYDRLLLETGK